MAEIGKSYSDIVYYNLRPLHANWEPTQPLALGDYGILAGHAFQRLGDITQLGIAIGDVIEDDVGDQKIFSSGTGTTVAFRAAGQAAAASAIEGRAGIDIKFGSEGSTFFNAAGCSYSLIANKTSLGDEVMKLFDAGTWNRGWAVVTDLVKSHATTVAIATASNAKITIETTAAVPQIDLANASIGLSASHWENVGYQIIAKAGLTPLLGLSKIQATFLLWNQKFKPLTSDILRDPDIAARLLDSREIETESRAALFFGQVF